MRATDQHLLSPSLYAERMEINIGNMSVNLVRTTCSDVGNHARHVNRKLYQKETRNKCLYDTICFRN